MKKKYNHTARLGTKFHKELENISKARKEKGLDGKKRSIRFLTDLIIKHDLWKQIRADMIEVNLEGVKYE